MNNDNALLLEQKNKEPADLLEEIFNSITHGIGFCAGIVGLVMLIYYASETEDAFRMTGVAIFGSSIILMYLFSSLYHSLIFTRSRKIFQILDHSAIFILIAGTYTPILLNFRNMFGIVLVIVQWSIVVIGIVLESVFKSRVKSISMILYIITGWIIVIAWTPLENSVHYRFFYWLFGGGIFYTFGIVFYVMQRIRFFHLIWHFFVLGGTVLHYLGILFYIAIK